VSCHNIKWNSSNTDKYKKESKHHSKSNYNNYKTVWCSHCVYICVFTNWEHSCMRYFKSHIKWAFSKSLNIQCHNHLNCCLIVPCVYNNWLNQNSLWIGCLKCLKYEYTYLYIIYIAYYIYIGSRNGLAWWNLKAFTFDTYFLTTSWIFGLICIFSNE
jgi:hypothetical protein